MTNTTATARWTAVGVWDVDSGELHLVGVFPGDHLMHEGTLEDTATSLQSWVDVFDVPAGADPVEWVAAHLPEQ